MEEISVLVAFVVLRLASGKQFTIIMEKLELMVAMAKIMMQELVWVLSFVEVTQLLKEVDELVKINFFDLLRMLEIGSTFRCLTQLVSMEGLH